MDFKEKTEYQFRAQRQQALTSWLRRSLLIQKKTSIRRRKGRLQWIFSPRKRGKPSVITPLRMMRYSSSIANLFPALRGIQIRSFGELTVSRARKFLLMWFHSVLRVQRKKNQQEIMWETNWELEQTRGSYSNRPFSILRLMCQCNRKISLRC